MAASSIILFTFALQASILAANHPTIIPSGWASHLNLPPLLSIATATSPSPRCPSSNITSLWAASPSPVRRSHASELCCRHSQHHPHSPFTCWCEIPMQLPILYSMSSSGEVTRALHGWQSALLQNCIIRTQSQHCQSSQICGAAVCASLFLRVSHSG